MGSRNLDRIGMDDWRKRCETVSDMARHGWDVIAQCRKCRVKTRVDLRVIIHVKGPNVSLWNRTPPCKSLGCNGVVDFLARIPGLYQHQALIAAKPTGQLEPGFAEKRIAELKAREGGKGPA